MIIKNIQISDIPHSFVLDAKRHGLTFCKTQELYGCFVECEMVGFCGVIYYKKSVTMKSQYIAPEHRGSGYFKKCLAFSINNALDRGIFIARAHCTPMSLDEYLKNGFVVVKRYNKYTKVLNENIFKQQCI